MKQSSLLDFGGKKRTIIDLTGDASDEQESGAIPASKRRKATNEIMHSGDPQNIDGLSIRHLNASITDMITASPGVAIAKAGGLDLLVFQPFILPSHRNELFQYLRRELPFYKVVYTVRGSQQVAYFITRAALNEASPSVTIKTPRYTCVWGCDDTGAPSSAYKKKPRAIPAALLALKDAVEARTNAHYNFVLVNYYADGKDSISWHSDDESFLGPLPCIASLSLGGNRDFFLKHKENKSLPQEKFNLNSGDMVVMRGTTQSKWLHSVPKRSKAEGRINITFRKALNIAGTNNYYRYNVGESQVFRWSEESKLMVEQPDS